jgi:glutamate 5-kinase
VIVSSGAIAVGRSHLGLSSGNLELEYKQASAATGQIQLAHAWQEALAAHKITVAQILLTPSDTEERRRHLNARATIDTLLRLGAVPVINENDSVATEEIRYGDNDRLAARVAQMISADTLVLLSDVDGLYSADPHLDESAELIAEVPEITPKIEAMAGSAPTGYSSGGMITKLDAAKIAMAAGCAMAITDGNPPNALSLLEDGAPCTWFLPSAEPLTARKRWIAGTVAASGSITIDDGAAAALLAGKSILPAGIIAVEGNFERGDAIVIKHRDGRIAGRGLSAYSSADSALIMGRKSRDIEDILGYRGRDEMIHRDDLVVDINASEARNE